MINDDRDAQLPCDYVVSLVMAFRAPVLAAVYLLPDPKVCLRSGPARPLTSRSSALPQGVGQDRRREEDCDRGAVPLERDRRDCAGAGRGQGPLRLVR